MADIEIQGKDSADKHRLRLLRTFSDAELSNVLKAHGRKIRGIDRADKIHTIIHSGLNARELLATDMYAPEDNQNQRKDGLKQLIADLEIDTDKLGTTLDERIHLIITSLANATDKLIDNYDLLAKRDVNALREVGADVAEADIGVKFEEVTKAMVDVQF